MNRWLAVLSFLMGLFCLAGNDAALARGGGGCFEQGTPVLAPQGEVPIEQLRVGDEVNGGRVAAAYQVQPDEYLELPNGIHVTPEHPFQIAPGTFRTAERVFPNAPRLPAAKPAYNLMISPGGTYTAGGCRVHNKGCFLPDTPILRADRSSAAISQVRVGERLLAFDADGNVAETAVRSVITREADGYLLVRTEKAELRVTREHPFYVGEGTFKTLEALHVGDTIFAFDGNGLTAQTINAIAPVPGKITVYNLQTDAPNTYFAAGIAVHNKGGGSSSRSSSSRSSRSSSSSRSSFHSHHHDDDDSSSSSNYSSSPGRPLDGTETCLLLCFFPGIPLLLFIAAFICSVRKGKTGKREEYLFHIRPAGVNQEEELDCCFSRREIEGKMLKTWKLLELIVQHGDDYFAPGVLKQRVRETFVQLQQCWQARDYAEMRSLLMPDLYEDHCRQLNSLRRNHEINVIEGLDVEQIDIVHLRCPIQENQREFTALITASAVDYYIDDRTRAFLRGDRTRARFQEFWTFQRQDGEWLLREIEQARESDVLKEQNYVEQIDAQELKQIADVDQDQQAMLKASRLERLLRSLAKTDPLWDITAMRTCARQKLIAVMAAKESGLPEQVPEEGMFPAAAEALRQHLAQMRESGLSAEYRNLCVRKVQIVHVRNCADNSQDEFTVRISGHAQLIVRRGNEVVKQDEHVRLFVEYWTFGRHGNRWKLKEVLPAAEGKRLEAAENLDEDNVMRQIQWQCR